MSHHQRHELHLIVAPPSIRDYRSVLGIDPFSDAKQTQQQFRCGVRINQNEHTLTLHQHVYNDDDDDCTSERYSPNRFYFPQIRKDTAIYFETNKLFKNIFWDCGLEQFWNYDLLPQNFADDFVAPIANSVVDRFLNKNDQQPSVVLTWGHNASKQKVLFGGRHQEQCLLEQIVNQVFSRVENLNREEEDAINENKNDDKIVSNPKLEIKCFEVYGAKASHYTYFMIYFSKMKNII